MLVLSFLLASVALAQQPELRAFLQRLKAVYAELDDLQAIVTILQVTPEGKEREQSRVRIASLVKQKVLRLEFLDPAEMRGTILTFKVDELARYIPVNNLIVIEKITERHALYPLLEFLNFDLEGIVARLEQEGFSLNLSQQISSASLALELGLERTIADLARARGATAQPLPLSLSITQTQYGMEDFPLALKVSAWRWGDYLLEARSPQEGLVSQELIWIDQKDLIPRRVEIHLLRQLEAKVREEVTVYLVSEIQLNAGLSEGALLALPKDAKIIQAPAK